MSIDFKKESPVGQKLKNWWKDLENNRGVRAEFRRAKNVNDILFIPSFHYCCRDFKEEFNGEQKWEIRLASILGLLSHAKVESNESLAKQMGKGDKKPTVSSLRFKKLLQMEREEMYVSMIRLIRLLNGNVNVYDLAESVYYWSEKRKRKWAFEYFGNINSEK